MDSDMIMDDILSMSVVIDNHKYPLKVKRAEEEKLRKAVQLINEKIQLYKQRFKTNGRSEYDFLAFVAIDLVSNFLDSEKKADDKELLAELRIMYNQIDEYIQKSQAL